MNFPLGQRLRELPGPLLLTGHTGFKGTWMTLLLENLNVPVVGYSLPPEKQSLFDRAERTGAVPEVFADIRDYETLEKFKKDLSEFLKVKKEDVRYVPVKRLYKDFDFPERERQAKEERRPKRQRLKFKSKKSRRKKSKVKKSRRKKSKVKKSTRKKSRR
jgi:hypothetical protein